MEMTKNFWKPSNTTIRTRKLMLQIQLSKKEYDYLYKSLFLGDTYKKALFTNQQISDKYFVYISEDQADNIRDLCGEQLQIAGFDAKYELTPEGKILESLMDKFLIK